MTALSPLGILQVIPYAKNAPLDPLMRDRVFEFASSKAHIIATSCRRIRYIYDSERNVTQNIRYRSRLFFLSEPEKPTHHDISWHNTADISCSCLGDFGASLGRAEKSTPKGIIASLKRSPDKRAMADRRSVVVFQTQMRDQIFASQVTQGVLELH